MYLGENDFLCTGELREMVNNLIYQNFVTEL